MREPAPVTVILPNYNHAPYVARALRAALDQAVPPRRVIVIDDGSTDDSVPRIQKTAGDDPRVTLIRQPRNVGVERCVEQALALCDTPYFCSIAAPDQLLPGFLAAVEPLMRSHPDAGLYLTDFAFRGDGGSQCFPKHLRLSSSAGYIRPAELVPLLKRSGYILPAYGCVFRTEAVREAGGFRPELRWHADWFTELVVAFRHGIGYVPIPLAIADTGDQNYSAGATDWSRQKGVLHELLRLLSLQEYADVASRVEASGALAFFGSGIVRAALASRTTAAELRKLPLGPILRTDLRRLVIRLGSGRARERYWQWRYRRAHRKQRTAPARTRAQ